MKISITGVDGSGKTSLVRALSREFGVSRELTAFRAPQYHEDPDAPFARLSGWIDEVSVLADELGDPLLKTSALFLSMTLYGDVEAHYERAFRPAYLVSERQAIADSLAYSVFYRGLLRGPIEESKIRDKIIARIGKEGLGALENWMPVMRGRLPVGSALATSPEEFWNLPLFIRDLFGLPERSLIAHLQSLYHCGIPDWIVFLRVSPDRLMERLALKRASGTAGELHEKRPILEALQQGLEKSCGLLAQASPSLRVDVLDTSELSLADTMNRFLGLVGIR